MALSGVAAGALLALLWVVFAIPELSHHGLAIDSPSLFYAGDRTLFWLEHPGHPEALDFTYPAPEPAGFHSAFFPFPDKNDPRHYPVFAGLVAAASAQATAHFGFSPIDGHHLGLVLLHAVGLVCFTVLAFRVFGARVGLLASAFLLCFPAAVGQAFNNAKDWPCADFYACALLASIEALVVRRPGAARTAGLFAGVALSCKLNGVFALACIGLLGLVALWQRSRAKGALDLSAARDLALIFALAGCVFFVLWPYLYHGPISGWPGHVEDYLQWYLAYGRSPRASWTDYPLRSLMFATPPLVLLCALASAPVIARARGAQLTTLLFVLGWIAVPILRTAVPHSNFYDGNRHFLEYIPGLCVLAAVGADWARAQISARLPAAAAEAGRLVLAFVFVLLLALPLSLYRPFEGTYFNFLIGGLGGAQSRALFDVPAPHDARVKGTEGDYWYGNLGDGLPHLKALLAPGQGVALCGPAPQQLQLSWPEGAPLLRQHATDADVLYVSPREVFCGLGLVRLLEAARPVLYRAERGGGLVYEILGAADGTAHPVLTAPSAYEADRRNFGTVW